MFASDSQHPRNQMDTQLRFCFDAVVRVSVRSEVSNRTCPKQNLAQQLNMIIMIDLADDGTILGSWYS